MVIGLKKNVCQNPKCCESSTKDSWNKKLEAYESRKAYFKPEHETSYGVIVIGYLSIFVQQVVRFNGCEIILTI
jgi:hypothetical protein